MLIGIDFGTDSVRALIVDSKTGEEISSSVSYYSRWKEGKYCDPSLNMFRQHPLDYIESLDIVISELVSTLPKGEAAKIKGIMADTTGSTPVAVNREGLPLALLSEFSTNPNAMFVLWKDHTAVKEAVEINKKTKNWKGTDYTIYEGGIYSSEWFWAKILHILRKDEKIRENAFSWVEQCDWITAWLTGNTDPLVLKRSRCAAGHKAMWHESWDGLPSEEFLVELDPLLKGLRKNLYEKTYTSDEKAGNISRELAKKFGLSEDVVISVGALDAHVGAVGGQIKEGTFMRIIGTSTSDIMVTKKENLANKVIPGICGQVDGSVIPGLIGLEAGQSAFGDVYAWFRDVIMWFPSNAGLLNDDQLQQLNDGVIPMLSEAASKLPLSVDDPVSLDWLNGRRTPDANEELKAALTGLSLGSSAPVIFKSLVEATAFGSKSIVGRIIENGVEIKLVVGLGGVAKKSEFVMQTLSNVLDMPIKVVKSEQACALGAAIFAATTAGIYKSVGEAQKNMGSGFENEYHPQPDKVKIYKELYKKYLTLGKFVEDGFDVMNKG